MTYQFAAGLLLMAAQCSAAELSLRPVPSASGESTVLIVTLSSSAGAPAAALTGIQFDLEYDVSTFEVSVSSGAISQGAGKGISTAANGSGKRVLVVGLNQNALSDGVVAVLHVVRKGPAAPEQVIRLAAPAGTNGAGTSIQLALRDSERLVP